MPRSNREYLLRYADQALNDLDRSLERLHMLSDAYGGIYKPMDGETLPELKEVPESYEGQHGKYQQAVDLIAAQLIMARDDLANFKAKFM